VLIPQRHLRVLSLLFPSALPDSVTCHLLVRGLDALPRGLEILSDLAVGHLRVLRGKHRHLCLEWCESLACSVSFSKLRALLS
jgi:hypothetical protein